MNKYYQHFKTITKHKWEVTKMCFKVGLYRQGLLHDLSKYSPAEFLSSAKYYQGNRSPIDAEKEDKGYSYAWLHHRGRNPHHWEYWVDNFGPRQTKQTVQYVPAVGNNIQTFQTDVYVSKPDALKIPYRYVIEMICDWIGAGKIYLKDKWTEKSPLEFYENNKSKMLLHPDTKKLIEKLLKDIADFGIRSFVIRVKNHKKNKALDEGGY